MIEAVIFDLDNTLYDEDQYVRSGFKAVSHHISKSIGIEESKVYGELISDYEKGLRKRNFDVLICKLNLREVNVQMLVKIYRSHSPEIELYEDSKECLEHFKSKGYKTGLVTQGYVESQMNKIRALGLEQFMDSIVITETLGVTKEDSTRPWQIALQELKVDAEGSIYVGDNPMQDVVNPRKLGVKTIRISRSPKPSNILVSKTIIEADFVVHDLREVIKLIENL